ncbi:MerR family transcriptional regulator [Thermoactinospora rubra]|uniref:MerR family transcriptional regulator n=1 Tax=Thermoactinospora rubra TaxID=1088767 RepID=UPI0019824A85|nr:MerR family transcriptional regulator [Thermoactinospora rubra]
MAELSEAAGVPVPTIKYYMREGLVPPGRPTGRNQADYDQGHVRKIKLVRALADYGGLSIAAIRGLMHELDNPATELHRLLGAAQRTVTEHTEPRPGPHVEEAQRRIADLAARRGWHWEPDHPSFRTAVGVLSLLAEIGRQDMIDVLDGYAEAAERIAQADLAALGDLSDRERVVEVVVIGTALGDTLIAALRRMVQAHLSHELLGGHVEPPAR